MAAEYRYEIKFWAKIGKNGWWSGFADGYADYRYSAFKKARKFLNDPDHAEWDWVRIHDKKTGEALYLTRTSPI